MLLPARALRGSLIPRSGTVPVRRCRCGVRPVLLPVPRWWLLRGLLRRCPASLLWVVPLFLSLLVGPLRHRWSVQHGEASLPLLCYPSAPSGIRRDSGFDFLPHWHLLIFPASYVAPVGGFRAAACCGFRRRAAVCRLNTSLLVVLIFCNFSCLFKYIFCL